MKTIKELDKMIEDEDACAYDLGKYESLKYVLGLIDEEYEYWKRLDPSPQNLELLRRVRDRLKKRISG